MKLIDSYTSFDNQGQSKISDKQLTEEEKYFLLKHELHKTITEVREISPSKNIPLCQITL